MKTLRQLERFVQKRRVAFLASVDEQGFPNLKAMLRPRRRQGLTTFYFSTNTSSLRVAQYRTNPKASLYFYRKGLLRYEGLMLTGLMEVLEDPAIKQALWLPGDKLFYSKGVTDPDYCVLRFTAQKGRYYCDLKTHSFTVSGLDESRDKGRI